MPRFVYKVKKGLSEIVEGTIEAETRDAAVNKLCQFGYYPIQVKEEEVLKERGKTLSFSLSRKIPTRDLATFTRQLSDLLESGLTLFNALGVISEQTENKRFREVIDEVSGYVRDGKTLSEAMARHGKIFSNLYLSLIRAGEVGGALEKVLANLADFTEKEEEVKTKVRSAMAYPVLILCVGIATIVVLLTFVIPKLVTMFEEMGQVLPLPTRILIGVSSFFTSYWWLVAAVVFLIFFTVRRQGFTKEGKFAIDRLRLRLPIMGDLTMKSEIARFGRVMGALLANGVPILQSLEAVAQTMENEVLRREVETFQREVREGSSLAKSIKKSLHFPKFVTNMVAVGEEGGLLEKSLSKVADSYERQADKTMKVMTTLLEPGMILVMGCIVGFVVISMLLPIFQINLMVH